MFIDLVNVLTSGFVFLFFVFAGIGDQEARLGRVFFPMLPETRLLGGLQRPMNIFASMDSAGRLLLYSDCIF